MGLDACVYCDCVEKGRLTSLPPPPNLLYIEQDGCPLTRADDIESSLVFDAWTRSRPCPHEDFYLVNSRLGNMSDIDFIKSVVKQLSSEPEKEYPILWSKVIYNGIHASDFLLPEQAVTLGAELKRLRLQPLPQLKEGYVAYWLRFVSTLEELVEASRTVGKPISF